MFSKRSLAFCLGSHRGIWTPPQGVASSGVKLYHHPRVSECRVAINLYFLSAFPDFRRRRRRLVSSLSNSDGHCSLHVPLRVLVM